MAGEIFILSDNLLQIGDYDADAAMWTNGLKNESTGLYINDADVTARVVHKADRSDVGGVIWPISLVYVAASNGGYRGVLPYTMDIANKDKLIVLISIDGGAGLIQHRECHVKAAIKDCS